LIDAK
jgi:hypothetical protein